MYGEKVRKTMKDNTVTLAFSCGFSAHKLFLLLKGRPTGRQNELSPKRLLSWKQEFGCNLPAVSASAVCRKNLQEHC